MDDDFNIMYEVLGIMKFMIYLSQRVPDTIYQIVCDIQNDYLDEQLKACHAQSGAVMK